MTRDYGLSVTVRLQRLSGTSRMYGFHYQTSRSVRAFSAEAFDVLDEHERLSAHMMKSSAIMAGSKMELRLDGSRGCGVGAKIALGERSIIVFWQQCLE